MRIASLNTEHVDSFRVLIEVVRESLHSLERLRRGSQSAVGYQTGIFLWLRSIEASQGAAHLADLGMPGTASSALRTAFECLFYACALWRKPELEARLLEGNIAELQKMASKVKAKLPEVLIDHETVEMMDRILALREAKAQLSAFDAAEAADLLHLYETAYRGLSNSGAHGTWGSTGLLRSRMSAEGTLKVGPDYTQTRLIWGGARRCLSVGNERFISECLPRVVPPPNQG